MRRLLLCLLALIPIWTMHGQEDNCKGLCGRRPLAPSHSLPVVGGIDTMPGTWPWMVSIRTPFKSGYQHTCGGSLIGTRWILTAAHCFKDIRHLTNWELVFGTNKLSHPGPDAEVRFPKRVVQHENYQPRQQINDIALVELDDPVKCTDYIQPACFPDSSVDVSSMVHCYIAGWGYTREKDKSPSDVLKEAKVDLIPTEKCNSSNWYYGSISASNLCAGFEGGGIDTCQGDSGGPLMCRENRSERYWIVGVTAWGLGCARAQKPGVYTSTQNFYDWILGYTKEKATHEKVVLQVLPGTTPSTTSSPSTTKPTTSTEETSPPPPEQTPRKQEISFQTQSTSKTETTSLQRNPWPYLQTENTTGSLMTTSTTTVTTTETTTEATMETIPEDTTKEIIETTTEATTESSTTSTTPTTTKAPQPQVPPPKPKRHKTITLGSYYGYSGNLNWPKHWPFRHPQS
ncbi:acrosin-like [Ahaetulla prasina]|uniref:acrosin-like n=1 Tax=Ahaetulla prasina TaxID=499056 RepID=UPI00264A3C7E|nr:acrosin-like [Ahaetulla prasina]